jgi:hypothetical protein
VQEECAGEIEGRRDALVENAHLRAVADADDVSVDQHGVPGAELAHVLFGRGEGKTTLGHGDAYASRS